MQIQVQPGINQPKFLDINALQEHRFPEEIRMMNFPITLLHNHSHSPPGYVLVYEKELTRSVYRPRNEAEQNYYPCSWYLSEDGIKAYQFNNEKVDYDFSEIQQRLTKLQELGYTNYGTTVLPVDNSIEFENENGHDYVPLEKVEKSIMENHKMSETCIFNNQLDGCFWARVCGPGYGGRGHNTSGFHKKCQIFKNQEDKPEKIE